MALMYVTRPEAGSEMNSQGGKSFQFCQDGEQGGKRAWARGCQGCGGGIRDCSWCAVRLAGRSSSPLHPLILRRGRSQQTCGCQDTAIQTWNHQPPHGHMKTEEGGGVHREHMRLQYVYACRHTNMSSFALSTLPHTHACTHTPLTGTTQMFP